MQLPVHADRPAPSILIGGKAAAVSASPYVDRHGALFAAADFLNAAGVEYTVSSDHKTVTITNGLESSTCPCSMKKDVPFIPVAIAAQNIGGDFHWDPVSQTATILARIRMVREDSDQLSVATSFPVAYHVASIGKPERVFIDVVGASLGTDATTVPVAGDDVSAVRAKQMLVDTVRVVIDLKKPLSYHVASPDTSARIAVNLTPRGMDAPGGSYVRLASDGGNRPDVSSASDPNAGLDSGQLTPLNPTGISLNRSDATRHITDIKQFAGYPGVLNLDVVTSGPGAQHADPYKTFSIDQPYRLVLDLPGADFHLNGPLAASADCTLPMVNAMVKTVRWGMLKGSSATTGRIVLDLYKPFAYTVSSFNANDGTVHYTVSVLLNAPLRANMAKANTLAQPPAQVATVPATDTTADPAVQPLPATPHGVDGGAADPVAPVITNAPPDPGNILSGKVIVVDPGHGGHDGGAPGVGGIWEKDIVLSIAKLVRDDLTASGVKVIMTRADDTFIPLPDRSQMGVDNHADLFISIHADSSGSRNSHEGTTVYYHANLSNCRNMASAIASRLGQLNDGIRTDGVRSDYVRFPGVGFSVLRRSPEPSVLVETGYVNNDQDAAVLTNASSQKLIADGIVAGIKDFEARNAKTAFSPSRAAKSAVLAVTDLGSHGDN